MCPWRVSVCFQFFTLRVTPPAHSEALPRRADGTWQEETHIVNQSGQGEEGGPLGALLEGLGVLLGILGGSWDPLGALLGLSWGPLGSPGGPLGAILEVIDQKRGGPVPPPLWGHQDSLLGPSWSPLGALLGALGAVLGASWAPLGAFLGHLGAILRPQKRIGRETARRPKSLIFFRFLKDFGLLEGS